MEGGAGSLLEQGESRVRLLFRWEIWLLLRILVLLVVLEVIRGKR